MINEIKLQNVIQIDDINKYKQQIDNIKKQSLDKENKMISIHNKQIQNLTMKYRKQIAELINRKPDEINILLNELNNI